MNKYTLWVKKYENIIFFLTIIALSSIFRLTNLDLVEFKADEASNLLLATRIFFDHPLPYAGIATSVGILNPPFFVYLLIPFALISSDPKTLSFFIALINVLSMGFFFLIIKKYYNQTLAIITSVLMAVSPWSIILSRKIWPPDMVLPFVVLCIYSLHKIIIENKMKYLIILAVVLALLSQLDLTYILFSIFLIIFLVLANRNLKIEYIFIGLFIGAIPLLPYLIYQLSNYCPDCTLALNISKKLATAGSLDILIRPLQIASQGNFRNIFGSDISVFANTFPLVYKLKAIFYVEYVLIPFGLLLFWKKYEKFRFLIYAIIATLIAYFALHILPAIHYFAILIPFIFIYLGFSLHQLMSTNRFFKYLSYVLLVSIVGMSIAYNYSFFRLIQLKGGLSGDYGEVLGNSYPRAISQYSKYKYDKNFREIIFSSYMPTSIMHNPSFAQMLYPYQDTKNNLINLDTKLQQFSDNPIIIHELTAYYAAAPTRSTIDILTKKLKNIPEYKSIYNEILNLYLQKNYKNLYTNTILNFTFEYPRHWKAIEDHEADAVIISGDNYSLIINKNSSSSPPKILNAEYKTINQTIFNQKIMKTDCFVDGIHCGTSYSIFKINDESYQITFTPEQRYIESKNLKNAKDTLDDIIASLRFK